MRTSRYPSDMSDVEWALIEPLLPTAACLTPRGGAPEKWPRREIVDGIRYLVDNGQCRCLRGTSSSSRGTVTAVVLVRWPGHASMD
ncbi:transposase, partial [Streptomyces sp. NPDC101455]|uniref:transposase n=1 Tax=Streptomyces sp. NPDC101455 TaxID=3366142 RepID=UPI0038208B99